MNNEPPIRPGTVKIIFTLITIAHIGLALFFFAGLLEFFIKTEINGAICTMLAGYLWIKLCLSGMFHELRAASDEHESNGI